MGSSSISRSKVDETAAFIYFGDQFIVRQTELRPPTTGSISELRLTTNSGAKNLEEMGIEILDGRFLDFLDPWGNRVEITTYTNIQFSKHPDILQGMGLESLEKTDTAKAELSAGLGPQRPDSPRHDPSAQLTTASTEMSF